jgi:hypothetical protein
VSGRYLQRMERRWISCSAEGGSVGVGSRGGLLMLGDNLFGRELESVCDAKA